MLRLRAAQEADCDIILQLITELAEYEQLRAEVVADRAALQSALCAPSPRVFCTLAEWHNSPEDTSTAGFALWFYNFSTFKGRHGIYLEDLFVRPEFRGRGIGRALLQSLAQRCMTEGLARLEWAVLDWNRPALDFYAGLGAQALTQWVPHRVTGEALAQLAAQATHASPSRPQS